MYLNFQLPTRKIKVHFNINNAHFEIKNVTCYLHWKNFNIEPILV